MTDMTYLHYFGDKTPGQVHAELESALAEIERLKAKAFRSDGMAWNNIALQEKLASSHTNGLLRLLVFGATGTRNGQEGWGVDCTRAEFIRESLPDAPNACRDIAKIVGVDQAMREVIAKNSEQKLYAVCPGKESVEKFDAVIQAAVDAVPASQADAVRDALVNHYVQEGYQFVLKPSGEAVPQEDIGVWDYHGEMVVIVSSDPKDAD